VKAKSIKGHSTEEIKTALHQNIVGGFNLTLAIFFYT